MKNKYQKTSLNYIKLLQEFSSKDETRFILNGIYYDKDAKSYVATDGRRLIVLNESAITFAAPTESGMYVFVNGEWLIDKSKAGLKYPNYKQVVPGDIYRGDLGYRNHNITSCSQGFSRFLSEVYKFGIYNIDFLMPLKKYICEEISFFAADNLSPLLIKNDNLKIIIMPLR
jgi:hypothetical protein